MSNTPFLFIGILLLYLQEYLLEKHFIRGSTNVSFWELPAVRRTSVSVLCDNWYGW